MISLADFQPMSIAKINIFHRQHRFYGEMYYNAKVHANDPLYKP